MLKTLLYQFNQTRKKKYFESMLLHTNKKYAFIGIGMHSLSSLYPVLSHFNIAVKYILTKQSAFKEIQRLFPSATLTHDINDIIKDDEVEGVFICATASAHFDLISRLSKADKKIFVEKPPCQTTVELNTLINITGAQVCKVGLQRRYWPGNKTILKSISTASDYNYRFLAGTYPQGDVYTELFIHPLDYIAFLFGDYEVQSFSKHGREQNVSVQLHVKHNSGKSGLIELSTQHSWNNVTEELYINTAEEQLQVKYPMVVSGLQKPKRLLNIPAERLLQQPVVTKNYFTTSNLIVPAFENNSLFLQGFYTELETFIRMVETEPGKNDIINDLRSLVTVYAAIEQLKAD